MSKGNDLSKFEFDFKGFKAAFLTDSAVKLPSCLIEKSQAIESYLGAYDPLDKFIGLNFNLTQFGEIIDLSVELALWVLLCRSNTVLDIRTDRIGEFKNEFLTMFSIKCGMLEKEHNIKADLPFTMIGNRISSSKGQEVFFSRMMEPPKPKAVHNFRIFDLLTKSKNPRDEDKSYLLRLGGEDHVFFRNIAFLTKDVGGYLNKNNTYKIKFIDFIHRDYADAILIQLGAKWFGFGHYMRGEIGEAEVQDGFIYLQYRMGWKLTADCKSNLINQDRAIDIYLKDGYLRELDGVEKQIKRMSVTLEWIDLEDETPEPQSLISDDTAVFVTLESGAVKMAVYAADGSFYKPDGLNSPVHNVAAWALKPDCYSRVIFEPKL